MQKNQDVKLLSGQGRTTRRDYIACTLLFTFFSIMVGNEIPYAISFYAKMFFITILIVIIWLQITVSMKRLHDVGLSGWYAILHLIVFINVLLIFYLATTKGEKGDNKFGRNPRELTYNTQNTSNNNP